MHQTLMPITSQKAASPRSNSVIQANPHSIYSPSRDPTVHRTATAPDQSTVQPTPQLSRGKRTQDDLSLQEKNPNLELGQTSKTQSIRKKHKSPAQNMDAQAAPHLREMAQTQQTPDDNQNATPMIHSLMEAQQHVDPNLGPERTECPDDVDNGEVAADVDATKGLDDLEEDLYLDQVDYSDEDLIV